MWKLLIDGINSLQCGERWKESVWMAGRLLNDSARNDGRREGMKGVIPHLITECARLLLLLFV